MTSPDPLCWAPRHPPWPPEDCICHLLRQARADERELITALGLVMEATP